MIQPSAQKGVFLVHLLLQRRFSHITRMDLMSEGASKPGTPRKLIERMLGKESSDATPARPDRRGFLGTSAAVVAGAGLSMGLTGCNTSSDSGKAAGASSAAA